MTKILAGLLGGLAMLAMVTVAHAQVVLSASSILPTNNFLTRNTLSAWGADVERVTEGRVKVNLLPKPAVAPPGTLDAVKDGLIDVAWTVHGLTPARFVLTNIAEFPGNGDSAEQMSVAYQRIHERHLAKAGEHKGVKVIALFTHGPGQLLSARRPVNTIEDLAGMKFRTPGGIALEVAKAVGAVGVPRPVTEIYELLNGGIVDGVFFPLDTIASLKLEQIIRHMTTFPGGLYNASFVMIMNEERFNKLSRRDQEAIDAIGGEAFSRRVGRGFEEQERASMNALAASKVAMTDASPALMQAFRARTAAIEANWVKQAAAKGIDGAKVLEEFRAEVRKVGR